MIKNLLSKENIKDKWFKHLQKKRMFSIICHKIYLDRCLHEKSFASFNNINTAKQLAK